jgi:hypothetical protein
MIAGPVAGVVPARNALIAAARWAIPTLKTVRCAAMSSARPVWASIRAHRARFSLILRQGVPL